MTFLYMIALRNQTVAYTFLPSFTNANSRLCLAIFFSDPVIFSMVTWRHTSLYLATFIIVRLSSQGRDSPENHSGKGKAETSTIARTKDVEATEYKNNISI